MPKLTRRVVLVSGLTSTATPLMARAQVPPLIKLVVPYAPGGSVDTLSRLLVQPLQEILKTTVVVDNRPGAGGRIATSQVKREAPNGSAVLIAPNALTTIQSLVYADKIDYKFMEDFAPVSRLANFPYGLAVPAISKVRTVADLKAAMKASASPTFGTSGTGGTAQFAGLVLGREAGINWTHVAYKGGAPLVSDLIGGHIPAAIDTLIDQIEYHRAGKIRVIGILSEKRYALAPNVPTLAEQGVKLAPVDGWFGAYVPAKTPREVIAKLDAAIAQALAAPDIVARLQQMVIEPAYLNSADFTKLQAEEFKQWGPVVQASGFKPQ